MRRIVPAILITIAQAAMAFPTPPIDLSINEGQGIPLGFHDATTSFAWQLEDPHQDAGQTSYQLVVTGTTNELPQRTGNPVVHLRKSFRTKQLTAMARPHLTKKDIIDCRIDNKLGIGVVQAVPL